jgi:hypothetical protein
VFFVQLRIAIISLMGTPMRGSVMIGSEVRTEQDYFGTFLPSFPVMKDMHLDADEVRTLISFSPTML